MNTQPISQEVGAALARFFFGGAGPAHSKVTRIFMAGGYGDADPGIPAYGTAGGPNKEQRMLQVFGAAVRKPANSKALVEAALTELRVHGSFTPGHASQAPAETISAAQAAFRRVGWCLADDGQLSPMGDINLSTGGRVALEEQLERVRRNTDDPAALLGTAKDLLEAVAKFVLEGVGFPITGKEDFNKLWYLSRERLNLLPQNVDPNIPGQKSIQAVLGSAWNIADQVNALRNFQGTGHGRTLPTGVTGELALLVVREACSVADFMLSTLDRQLGKRAE